MGDASNDNDEALNDFVTMGPEQLCMTHMQNDNSKLDIRKSDE